MHYAHKQAKNKNIFCKRLKESLLVARLSGNQFHITGPATEKTHRP